MSRGARVPTIKAHVVETDARRVGASRALGVFGDDSASEAGGAVKAPLDPDLLVKLWEVSSVLGPNVAAYAQNIEGHGHRFEPTIDLEAPDARNRVSEAIYFAKLDRAEDAKRLRSDRDREEGESPGGRDREEAAPPRRDREEAESHLEEARPDDLLGEPDPFASVPRPSDDEVEQASRRLAQRMRVEFNRLQAFFASCSAETSFTELRRRTRVDLEVTGNAYWEVLRNRRGQIARFVLVPSTSMRLMPLGEEQVEFDESVRTSEFDWQKIRQRKRFRRYLQLDAKRPYAYFRELGDPRVISRKTGVVFASSEALRAAEGEDALGATEMIHFVVFALRSGYGLPRWIGNLPAVMGSRQLDETNQSYFDQSAIPPLALLVSGGRLAGGVVERVRDFLDEAKGATKRGRVLVLEAEVQRSGNAGGLSTAPKLHFERLRDMQQQDATHQLYDDRNRTKISMSFRQPRIVLGGDANLNRATAFAALRFAESQVYQPERQAFDDFVNRRILPALDVRLWEFRSLGPERMDPEVLGALAVDFVATGVISVNEGRQLASQVFRRAFLPLAEGPREAIGANGRGSESEHRDALAPSTRGVGGAARRTRAELARDDAWALEAAAAARAEAAVGAPALPPPRGAASPEEEAAPHGSA